MSEPPSDSESLPYKIADVVRMLTYQQFYEGADIIFGRTKENSIKIRNSGLIIHTLNQVLLDSPLVSHLEHNEYEAYLDTVVKRIPILNRDKIWQKFSEKASILGDFSGPNAVVGVTFMLSEIVTEIRAPGFQKCMDIIRERVKAEMGGKYNQEELMDRLCGLNNPHISLLENLTFLNTLAELFHFKSVTRICAIQISKHMNMAIGDFKNSLNKCSE